MERIINDQSLIQEASHYHPNEEDLAESLPRMTQYASLIERFSKRHKIDETLVRAMIYVESKFDPKAVSKKGAQGLMQIMPRTAKSIAKRLGIINYNPFNPSHNIRVGIFYIKELEEDYGDITSTVAAYHEGPGTMNKLRESLEKQGIEPAWQNYKRKVSPNTRRYVYNVMGAYSRFSQI